MTGTKWLWYEMSIIPIIPSYDKQYFQTLYDEMASTWWVLHSINIEIES